MGILGLWGKRYETKPRQEIKVPFKSLAVVLIASMVLSGMLLPREVSAASGHVSKIQVKRYLDGTQSYVTVYDGSWKTRTVYYDQGTLVQVGVSSSGGSKPYTYRVKNTGGFDASVTKTTSNWFFTPSPVDSSYTAYVDSDAKGPFSIQGKAGPPPSQPKLSVQPTSYDFGTVNKGSTPSKTFSVSNAGSGTLEWHVNTFPSSWLTIQGGGGQAGAGSFTARVRSDATAGSYSGSIDVRSNDGHIDVTVTATVVDTAPQKHFITTRTDPQGIGISGGGNHNHNSSAFIGPAPNIPGYTFSYWRRDGGQTIGTNPSGVTVTVNAAMLIEAVYEEVTTAKLIEPNPDTILPSSSATFKWSSGQNVLQYFLYVGTSAGESDIYAQSAGLSLSALVCGIPTDGSNIYVGLWSKFSDGWKTEQYVYKAAVVKANLNAPISYDSVEEDGYIYHIFEYDSSQMEEMAKSPFRAQPYANYAIDKVWTLAKEDGSVIGQTIGKVWLAFTMSWQAEEELDFGRPQMYVVIKSRTDKLGKWILESLDDSDVYWEYLEPSISYDSVEEDEYIYHIFEYDSGKMEEMAKSPFRAQPYANYAIDKIWTLEAWKLSKPIDGDSLEKVKRINKLWLAFQMSWQAQEELDFGHSQMYVVIKSRTNRLGKWILEFLATAADVLDVINEAKGLTK
ncbi:hypothetical protein ACFLWS_03995 [Chloroflexota bacterium]